MSNECVTIAQKRRVGSATKKSVLIYLADRASDDGSGIWTSKAHIAADTELSKRSVQNAMNEFEAMGLLVRVGRKPCKNGFTFEYRLALDVLLTLPSTREETGAGDSPVQEIHLTGAGDSPHGVQEIHPNHPITIQEPPNTCESDLFSAREEPESQSDSSDLIEEGWKEFQLIWPKGHPRREMGKVARKKYEMACRGKNANSSGSIDPKELNRAAKSYIASVRDPQFIKGTEAWLNGAKWEQYLDAPSKSDFNFDDLNINAQNILQDGRCPPSMRDENGAPNEIARYWLKKLGHEVPA